jgi:hypothetical protein
MSMSAVLRPHSPDIFKSVGKCFQFEIQRVMVCPCSTKPWTNMYEYDELVPRPRVAKEMGVSHRTVCRWEALKRPGFDHAVKIGLRVFHRRSKIEAVKAGLPKEETA